MIKMNQIKKIAYQKIKKYSLYWFPILLLQISLLLIAFFFNKNIGKYFGIIFAIITGIIFFTYLAIFDGGTALKIRKDNFKIEGQKYKKEELIAFYNSLKLITLLRGIINFMSILIIIGISTIFFI